MLSACYTWPLISPWCPISLDLWWPSFRSFNIKALKCLPSQPHTHTHTNRPIQYTCNYSGFLLYSLLSLPHMVPFIHISFPHLNPNPVSKYSAEFWIQNLTSVTRRGVLDASRWGLAATAPKLLPRPYGCIRSSNVFEPIWNGALNIGTTLWAIQSGATHAVAAQRRWQWLLACSGLCQSRPITASETKKKQLRQSPNLPESAMPSALRFDWSQQNSHDHITWTNTDRKLPKEPDCHCSIPPLVFATKLFVLFFPSLGLVRVCVCSPNVVFLVFLSVCSGTLQGPFPLAVRSESFFLPLKPRRPSKKRLWHPVSR